MRLILEEDLAHCGSLDEVQQQLQETLRWYNEQGYDVSYVAGPISADGDENIPRNIDTLIAVRDQLVIQNRQANGNGTSFTAPFVFTTEVYRNLGIFEMERVTREQKLQAFWDELILSGLVFCTRLGTFSRCSNRASNSTASWRSLHRSRY